MFFFPFFGNKYHVSLTCTGKQLAGSIITAWCSLLPICQSAIIGASVLYIYCAGQKDKPHEQNGHCLPLGRCVQSRLSQTGSPGNPAADSLISSNCLITSKAASKHLDCPLSWLKPRQPCPFKSGKNPCVPSMYISSHRQSYSRKHNWK